MPSAKGKRPSAVRHKTKNSKRRPRPSERSWLLSRTVTIGFAAFFLLAILGFKMVTNAAPTPTSWFVKGKDLQPWGPPGHPDVGLTAEAAGQNLKLPTFTWTLCGAWNGVTYARSDDTTCTGASGSTLVFEDYNQFRAAIAAGLFTTLHMSYAVYDIESWTYTPSAQSSDPGPWIKQAVTLAATHNIKLVVTFGGGVNTTANDVAATEDGAYMVGVQSQGWGRNQSKTGWSVQNFDSKLSSTVRAVRAARSKAHTDTLIMAGLATNTPRVHSVSVLRQEYAFVQSLSVSRVWLNANDWQTKNRCTAADGGYGCPLIGAEFLAAP